LQHSSDSLEGDFHGGMHLLVVFRDWLDVCVPTVFPAHLFDSFLSDGAKILFAILMTGNSEALSERVVSCSHRIWSHAVVPPGWRFRHVFPVFLRLSKEWNRVCELLCLFYSINHFPSIWNVAIQNEWSCIKRSLELTLCRSHRWSIFRTVLYAKGLHLFSRYRLRWCILSEKFRVCHRWIVKGYVVVHWSIKILSVGAVSMIIVFWAFNVKVGDPAELAINIAVFWYSWIVWHSRSFDIVHFKRIWLPLWLN